MPPARAARTRSPPGVRDSSSFAWLLLGSPRSWHLGPGDLRRGTRRHRRRPLRRRADGRADTGDGRARGYPGAETTRARLGQPPPGRGDDRAPHGGRARPLPRERHGRLPVEAGPSRGAPRHAQVRAHALLSARPSVLLEASAGERRRPSELAVLTRWAVTVALADPAEGLARQEAHAVAALIRYALLEGI